MTAVPVAPLDDARGALGLLTEFVDRAERAEAILRDVVNAHSNWPVLETGPAGHREAVAFHVALCFLGEVREDDASVVDAAEEDASPDVEPGPDRVPLLERPGPVPVDPDEVERRAGLIGVIYSYRITNPTPLWDGWLRGWYSRLRVSNLGEIASADLSRMVANAELATLYIGRRS